jgi:NTP pyrophosphatase (non-canonical NTP hydrolase)
MSTLVLENVLAMAQDHLKWCPGASNPGERDSNPGERRRFLVNAMSGEAGEAANVSKKEWRGDFANQPVMFRAKLVKEVADTVAYAFMLAAHMRFDLLMEVHDAMSGAEDKLGKKQ